MFCVTASVSKIRSLLILGTKQVTVNLNLGTKTKLNY